MAAKKKNAASIDRDALHAWIDQQCDRIESTPVPPELATMGTGERLTGDEVVKLWHGAGLASQIGMALSLDPGKFIPDWPKADEEPEPEPEQAAAA